MSTRQLPSLFALLVVCSLSWAAAQHEIKLELGYAGEIVADAWNPLRLIVRDLPEAVLVLEMDQGTLRGGSEWVHYRAPLSGGSGIDVFEDDVYIPAWRSFTWRVQTDTTVLASGAFDRRSVDPRPLHLIASAEAGSWRDLLPDDARVLDIPTSLLPERAAGYDGVATLLVDGTLPPPRTGAVAAAAAAGVTVHLITPLPSSYAALEALTPEPKQRLGAGWLLRTPASGAAEALDATPRLEPAALSRALLTQELSEAPQGRSFETIMIAVTAYLFIVFCLTYFGRTPGLLTALAVAAIAGLGAWNFLRPASDLVVKTRSLSLGAGGLAYTQEVRSLVSLPARLYDIPVAAQPLDSDGYTQQPGGLRLNLSRWEAERLVVQPSLGAHEFAWQGRRLVNHSEAPLIDVFVIGLGPQESLGPEASLEPLPVEFADRDVPALYRPLIDQLPAGSALARRGGSVFVALPEDPAFQAARPAESIQIPRVAGLP